MNKKIGFIGGGNMGSAMISGLLSSNLSTAESIIASAHTQATLDRLAASYGIQTTLDNTTVAKTADIIFLAVKPYLYEDVIEEIRDIINDDKLIVAIAAGVSHSKLDDYFGKPVKSYGRCQTLRLWY